MEEKKLKIDSFLGINQVMGDAVAPLGMSRYTYGLYVEDESLERIGGKMCLHSSMKKNSMVIDITHLKFSDDVQYVMVHHSSSRELYDTADFDTSSGTADGIDEYGVGDNK